MDCVVAVGIDKNRHALLVLAGIYLSTVTLPLMYPPPEAPAATRAVEVELDFNANILSFAVPSASKTAVLLTVIAPYTSKSVPNVVLAFKERLFKERLPLVKFSVTEPVPVRVRFDVEEPVIVPLPDILPTISVTPGSIISVPLFTKLFKV